MGNIEIPGGFIIAKPPEFYGRKSLKPLAARVPKVDRAARGRCRHHAADLGPGDRHAAPAVRRDGDRAALRHRRLLRLPPRPADRDARRRGGRSTRWTSWSWSSRSTCAIRRRAGTPTSSCPSRPTSSAPTSWASCPARCRCSSMRDQAIAPRFDSRPAWWIFREILRRMGKMEALDFETIEELWNYQLEGTGVTVAEMRESGVVAPGRGAEADAARQAQVPDPLGQDRDRQRAAEAGRAAQPPALRAQDGAHRRPVHAAVRAARDAGARPVAEQPAPARDRARAGAVDPPRARRAAGHRRRRRGRGQRRRHATSGGSRPRSRRGSTPRRCSCCTATAPRCRWPRARSASAWPTSACSTASSTNSTPPAAATR